MTEKTSNVNFRQLDLDLTNISNWWSCLQIFTKYYICFSPCRITIFTYVFLIVIRSMFNILPQYICNLLKLLYFPSYQRYFLSFKLIIYKMSHFLFISFCLYVHLLAHFKHLHFRWNHHSHQTIKELLFKRVSRLIRQHPINEISKIHLYYWSRQ